MVTEKRPRNIQLQYPVYERLEIFRGKRESFSEAVARLLTMVEKVGALRNMLARVTGSGQLSEKEAEDASLIIQSIDTEHKENPGEK
jgi:predicted CopG family antitoxin